MAAAEKALKRRKQAETEEEKVIEFFNLPDRRQHFQEQIGELCELADKYLVKGAPEKTPGLSYFAYFFANFPSTRHEAHWQLQSFILLEVLQELKELNENLSRRLDDA
jgi:hypothetical protein